MTEKHIKLMAVHGLGGHDRDAWQADWMAELGRALQGTNLVLDQPLFAWYDYLFEDVNISAGEALEAATKLIGSGLSELNPFRRRRGLFDGLLKDIRFSAGYVVAWAADDDFRKKTRKFILNHIVEYKPDIVLAHSLGSLLTYDAFAHADAKSEEVKKILESVTYVTFGSQLGNPFVKQSVTNGRVARLDVRNWFNLYNKHDKVFTESIDLPNADNFTQIDTHFQHPDDENNHCSDGYFNHEATRELVWQALEQDEPLIGAQTLARATKGMVIKASRPDIERPKKRRALLVGINQYQSSEIVPLEGCVNDVFLMSAALQEIGFDAKNIRACLNSRATTAGILERLSWLLDDAQPEDELIFYCSSHGTRYPEYGLDGEPDRYVEALVPYDFDWDEGRAILDRQLSELYAQLPYKARFVMVFDACNSGGLQRSGSSVKGLTPPDDIRHRQLKWDATTQMWVPREFQRISPSFNTDKDWEQLMLGRSAASERLGRAAALRGISDQKYRAIRDEAPEIANGPYLPVIMSACQEHEYAYEYAHGPISYGAFTYSLVSIMRREGKGLSFEELVERTKVQLSDLDFDQRPELVGPTSVIEASAPW